jgi:hypothetical protein
MPDPLVRLANEVSSAVADLVEAAKENTASGDAIAQVLAEMVELARSRKEQPIVVNVSPTPVNVHIPASEFEICHEYDVGGRLVKSCVKRITKGM